MHLGSFLKVMVQNGDIFWGLLTFQTFLRCLIFLVIFWNTVDAGSQPTYEENMRVPPGSRPGLPEDHTWL